MSRLREADEQAVADADLANDAAVDANFGAGDALEENSQAGRFMKNVRGKAVAGNQLTVSRKSGARGVGGSERSSNSELLRALRHREARHAVVPHIVSPS